MKPWKVMLALWLLIITATIAGAVILGWDTSPGATGYRIYYGTFPSNYTRVIDFGNSTTGRVTGLQAGVQYFFAATAYNLAGESGFSAPISYTVPSLLPPTLRLLQDSITLGIDQGTTVSGPWSPLVQTQMFYRGWIRLDE